MPFIALHGLKLLKKKSGIGYDAKEGEYHFLKINWIGKPAINGLMTLALVRLNTLVQSTMVKRLSSRVMP
jgi:hypothetical protein